MKPEAVLAVATKSRVQGEQYLQHGNPGRAFAHFLVSLKLQPQWKPDLKDFLSTSLGAWGQSLEQQRRYRDLFLCYEQALEVFPENEEVLNNLGAHLFRLGHIREASHFFRKSLQANPEFLPATCNLESLSTLLVERWHFRMLNDLVRNEAYREAITKKVKQGFGTVLDIGTGSGILSLYAVDAGASEVYACECSPTMVQIAQQVYEANDMSSQVHLIPKLSNDIAIPQDMPNRVSLVVTETMDSGLLGEHVLQTLADAWDRLLLPPCPDLGSDRAGQLARFSSVQEDRRYGLVIPLGASIWVAAIESAHLSRLSVVASDNLRVLGLNPDIDQVTAHREEPYDSEDFTKLPGGAKLLTTPEDVIYINFNDPADISDCLSGKKEVTVNLSACEAGRMDAIIAWFSLRLDEDILLSSAPGKGSCWEQAIFPLTFPKEIQAGESVPISLSCHSGKLSVVIPNDDIEGAMKLSADAVRFLNDTGWTSSLVQVASDFINKKNLDVLDLSPFPVLGIKLLTQGSAQHITCLANCEKTQKTLKILVEEEKLTFVSEDEVENIRGQFDIIILQPISKSGELDQNVMLQIPILRELLKKGGLLLPRKMRVWGTLIDSEWLQQMSRVESDAHVGGYNIAEFVNEYQVTHHVGLNKSTLPHLPLCEPLCVMEMTPLELKPISESQERCLITARGEAGAILYWFELFWGRDQSMWTHHEASHVCQAAMLLEPGEEVSHGQEVCVTARQQHGFIHLGVFYQH